MLLATREHVVRNSVEHATFLSRHPIHQRIGGENAYRLNDYLDSLSTAGFIDIRWIGSMESPINYFPMSREEWEKWCINVISERLGEMGARTLARRDLVRRKLGRWASSRDQTPGRLYSFVAVA